MRTAAIIVAGGSGARLKARKPKQFVEIEGRPLLAHTLAPFEASPLIDRIVLVLPGDQFEEYARWMEPWVSEAVEMVPGGAERQDSVWRGLGVLPASFDGLVLVHDGARPAMGEETLRAVVRTAEEHGAAIAALPVHETLKEVGAGDVVAGTVDRRRLFRAQTPQCFRHELLRRAFEKALADGFRGTDEASLVERLGAEVRVVPGSERNLKVTTVPDLNLARFYLRSASEKEREMDYRVGLGFDAHRLVSARRLILGGVPIPHERGLEGYSDGDVLLHALADALLGAVGAPDIGSLFPPADPRFKDAPSRLFVGKAVQVVEERGFEVVQVDTTIIAEAPRLSGHFESIRRQLGEMLGIAPTAVGVKATTCDGMGFTGRGEGIAAQAVVMVVKQEPGGER